ncbi:MULTISPECIES: hypothetical protein [Pantoea]|uniref:Uncharacterized protein n=1 Tax=Candidatus Pantoea gossypiicola TaxID=2608008 RepID=A0AB34CMK7_9GAMM|nr:MULTISPECIES: hypothetical protein [Pantoea]KAA5931667.1 hypothetical protein F3I59_06250 [Pantoea sp. VH_8]KAA5936802.1 hypothetical protein F3I58_06280 [Pantoea sp. VH_4]KAA5988073.1 hypothetical protein F3I49_06175 [Pantoea sp. M_4]KAA6126699.1 hypothetical protein F3I20_06450 [Pantoea gossypiicola]
MGEAENIAVTEDWAVVYEGTDERTIAVVSGQAEMWTTADVPEENAIGLTMATGGASCRGSGRILGRAVYGTRRAVFIVL